MPKNSGFFRRKLFRIGGIRRARKLFNVLAVGIRLIASMRRSNMFAIMFVKSHISMCFFTIRVFFGLGTVLPRTQLYASTHFNFRSSTRYVRQIAVKKIICWVMNLQRATVAILFRVASALVVKILLADSFPHCLLISVYRIAPIIGHVFLHAEGLNRAVLMTLGGWGECVGMCHFLYDYWTFWGWF